MSRTEEEIKDWEEEGTKKVQNKRGYQWLAEQKRRPRTQRTEEETQNFQNRRQDQNEVEEMFRIFKKVLGDQELRRKADQKVSE